MRRPELSILLSGEFADTACKQSGSVGQWAPGTVSFNVNNANTLFSNNDGLNNAFMELGGPNSPVSGCGSSFDWGLSFFYGKPNGVFTGIEQQPVTGTTVVGPFWAY